MGQEFTSWRSFEGFAEKVKTGRRHVLDVTCRAFLEVVGSTSKSRVTVLPERTGLYRAQIAHTVRQESAYDHDSEEEVVVGDFAMPCEDERLLPSPVFAKEGRANPKGILAFYAAFDEETAIAEVRPWKGQLVSVGYFHTKRPLTCVDCTRHVETQPRQSRFKYALANRNPQMREESVWFSIEEAFATPITPSDTSADYVPTQILTELFIHEGYDGVVFKSSIGPGSNIALFGLDDVEHFESSVASITGIKVDFRMGSYDGIPLDQL